MAPRKKIKNPQADDLDEIFARVLTDLQVASEEDDLPVLMRLLVFVDGCLNTVDTKGTKLDQIRTKALDLQQKWVSNLKEGDSVELYSLREDKWYGARIVSMEKENKLYLKYYGWDDKYNREVDILSSKLAPPETFIILKKVQKRKKAAEEMDDDDEEEEIDETKAPSEDMNPEQGDNAPGTEDSQLCVPIDSNHRRTRRGSHNPTASPLPKKEIKTLKKKKTADEEEQVSDHNDWICDICHMIEAPKGTELVLCDGPCRRSFHLECLTKKPKAIENIWVCEGCKTHSHECFLCKKSGRDYLVRKTNQIIIKLPLITNLILTV